MECPQGFERFSHGNEKSTIFFNMHFQLNMEILQPAILVETGV